MWKMAGIPRIPSFDETTTMTSRHYECAMSDATPSEIRQLYIENSSRSQSPLSVDYCSNRTDLIPRRPHSRWGEVKPEEVNPVVSISAANRAENKLDSQAVRRRIEEIDLKLDMLSLDQRAPLSELNSRVCDSRYRKLLEDERASLLSPPPKDDCNLHNAQFPKRIARPYEKVYIPVKEFPDINFFGLLVGPRGNSLKRMERDSGAKISIRGKGSVKEGKTRLDQSEDAEEDLHCLVLADSEDKVAACVKMINKVIETAASTPEGQNDHKRNQLRELAALNGTLRDDENHVCQNCGVSGHRKYDCPEHRTFTSHIVCRACGGAGHIARDCIAASVKDVKGATPTAKASPLTNNLNRFDALYSSTTPDALITAMDPSFLTSSSDFKNRDSGTHLWSFNPSWPSLDTSRSSAASEHSVPSSQLRYGKVSTSFQSYEDSRNPSWASSGNLHHKAQQAQAYFMNAKALGNQ